MKIKWVNHASFIFDYDNVMLITDPWIEGTAFDNGWSLLAKPVIKYEDFANITHIWFSHEHPDHFSPANINKIPAGIRKNITILYHETIDKKVVKYCEKSGFKEIIEMKPDSYYRISGKTELLCNPYTNGDSYLYIKTDSTCLLNINDCIINDTAKAKAIQAKTGRVDVLFTQFCYANKIGNTADTALRKEASAERLQRIKNQSVVFNPSAVIPFASYVYFGHEENYYMNDGFNKIGAVHNFITRELGRECVVLYPGEEWVIGTVHSSEASIKKYDVDYDRIHSFNNEAFLKSESIERPLLIEQSLIFASMIKKGNTTFLLHYLSPMKVFIKDYKEAFAFSLSRGLYKIKETEINCDLSLNSEALYYAFKFLWGGDTLYINARFQVPAKGVHVRARQYFGISLQNNRGESITTAEAFNFIKSVQKSKVKRWLGIGD